MAVIRTYILAAVCLAATAWTRPAVAQVDAGPARADASARASCASFSHPKKTGHIQHKAVDEASGLAASWRYPPRLWTHNDSAGQPRLYLIEPDGSTAAVVELAGPAKAVDWEDVAVGPCWSASRSHQDAGVSSAGPTGHSCVYIADIGDNRRSRDRVVIYQFREPDIPDDPNQPIVIDDVDAAVFRYPGGPVNAETVMVHPDTAQMYVVEKTARHAPAVYRVPHTSSGDNPVADAVKIGQLDLGQTSSFATLVTAGDISPNGHELTVRTYLSAYSFCAPDATVEQAIKHPPTSSPLPFMLQAEALAYGRRGQSIWLTSEHRPAPIYRLKRRSTP